MKDPLDPFNLCVEAQQSVTLSTLQHPCLAGLSVTLDRIAHSLLLKVSHRRDSNNEYSMKWNGFAGFRSLSYHADWEPWDSCQYKTVERKQHCILDHSLANRTELTQFNMLWWKSEPFSYSEARNALSSRALFDSSYIATWNSESYFRIEW